MNENPYKMKPPIYPINVLQTRYSQKRRNAIMWIHIFSPVISRGHPRYDRSSFRINFGFLSVYVGNKVFMHHTKVNWVVEWPTWSTHTGNVTDTVVSTFHTRSAEQNYFIWITCLEYLYVSNNIKNMTKELCSSRALRFFPLLSTDCTLKIIWMTVFLCLRQIVLFNIDEIVEYIFCRL